MMKSWPAVMPSCPTFLHSPGEIAKESKQPGSRRITGTQITYKQDGWLPKTLLLRIEKEIKNYSIFTIDIGKA